MILSGNAFNHALYFIAYTKISKLYHDILQFSGSGFAVLLPRPRSSRQDKWQRATTARRVVVVRCELPPTSEKIRFATTTSEAQASEPPTLETIRKLVVKRPQVDIQ